MARSVGKQGATTGDLLRILRAATDKTQRNVAAGTGLDHSFISLVESGQRPVTRDVARTLGEFFLCSDEDEAE